MSALCQKQTASLQMPGGRPRAASSAISVAVPTCLEAGAARATKGAASPGPSRSAMRTPSPTCRLLHDRGHLLNLRVEARRSRRLGLRAGRHGHRSQYEQRSSQCHRQVFQDTLPRFANCQSRQRLVHFSKASREAIAARVNSRHLSTICYDAILFFDYTA